MDSAIKINADLLEQCVKALYETPKHRPMDAAKRMKMDRAVYTAHLAAAALEGLYDAYGLIHTLQPKAQRYGYDNVKEILAELAKTGSVLATAKKFDIAANTLQKWLRPAEFVYGKKTQANARNYALKDPNVMGSLTESVLKQLAREDQIQAAMLDKRMNLAAKLYDEATFHWNKAHELASMENIPASPLKAVVTAAHYAVKDAQLLSGQATDRVEGFLTGISDWSDDELRAFINEDVIPRELINREDAAVVIEEHDEGDA